MIPRIMKPTRLDSRSKASANEPNRHTEPMSRRHVQLLTRAGCAICDGVHAQLKQLAKELDFDLSTTDVDQEAAKGDTTLRAEFGDRLPVVLLDGREHSYWKLDEPRLRKDLSTGGLLRKFGGPSGKR